MIFTFRNKLYIILKKYPYKDFDRIKNYKKYKILHKNDDQVYLHINKSRDLLGNLILKGHLVHKNEYEYFFVNKEFYYELERKFK